MRRPGSSSPPPRPRPAPPLLSPHLHPPHRQQLPDVLGRYQFKTYRVIPVQVEADAGKGVWQVETDRGTVCLKRTGQPADRMAFSIAAQLHLAAHGAPVPRLIPARDGTFAVESAGRVYVAYQWISGRSVRWENRDDLQASVEALASLHGASRGFTVPAGVKVFTKLGRWPDHYAEMEERLQKWKVQAEQQPEVRFHALFLAGVDTALELAARARAALATSPYDVLVQRTWPGDTLIHQDFGPSNIIMTGTGPCLLDLDTVTLEFPARNLRKLMGELMQSKGGWRSDIIDEVLGWYTKINPLPAEHLHLLGIDLMFPHVFHDSAKNWFKKNKPEKPDRMERACRFEREKADTLTVWLPKLR